MSEERQGCSEAGCSKPAAFGTRTNLTWRDDHITAKLRAGGLEPLEPFKAPKAWRLTRCLACGCEAHYRFEYTLDQNRIGVETCRACYWRGWAEEQRRLLGGYANLAPIMVEEARTHAEQHGFEYLGPLTSPSLTGDPHRTKCGYCGRISAERLGDIGWMCTCQTNPRRAAGNQAGGGKPARNLLKDSSLPALQWWDHEANDASAWETVTVKARREVFWRCPTGQVQRGGVRLIL